MYVYIKSDVSLWTTGFYKPDGTWEADQDFNNSDKAAERVSWLNGNHHVNFVQLNEDIQNDLLTWASDKKLEYNDKTTMCQIVINRLRKFL